VSEVIAASWEASEAALAPIPTSAACLLTGGKAPGAGEMFRNPDLARSLRLIADGGVDAFYKGQIAKEVEKYSNEVGGFLSAQDFAKTEATWVDPVSTNYRGYDVWELPPNGQGIAALQMLNLLERYDLKAMGHNSAEALHLMIEAKKLAFEDRAAHYAETDAMRVPVERLISKEYADERAEGIDPARASERPEPGIFPQADTIYMTVADGEGNVVSLIQSLFHGFGSRHVPGRLGFPLQNRGSQFSLDPGHPNHLAPGKRPFHTIIPAFVTKDGAPWLSFGVMGGDMQPQGHVQVLVNLIDFGMDVQAAGEAARFRHDGSSEPTGLMAKDGGVVYVESGIDPEVREGLRARGHRVELATPGGAFGGYQGIRIDGGKGLLIGGSDPRKDGAAGGY
jgi:gamma-glutamyltranspeptidase/glutathione hydrolase